MMAVTDIITKNAVKKCGFLRRACSGSAGITLYKQVFCQNPGLTLPELGVHITLNEQFLYIYI